MLGDHVPQVVLDITLYYDLVRSRHRGTARKPGPEELARLLQVDP